MCKCESESECEGEGEGEGEGDCECEGECELCACVLVCERVCACVCVELCYKESTVISHAVCRNSKRTSFPLQCFKQQGAEGPSAVSNFASFPRCSKSYRVRVCSVLPVLASGTLLGVQRLLSHSGLL